jgi:predicted AlkP superfamily pyrophosphatase or phosphodiesterase
MSTKNLVVLDVVGLTSRLLAHMPRLSALAARGFRAELQTTFPAVTCSVQSSLLTGLPPSAHGVVGNGWYFRDLGEIYFWRQHNALVRGEKVWETARRTFPDYKAANLCWWYAMGASTDVVLTPRPVYHADGRKSPDCYTVPSRLRDELTAELGRFPLFQYWGPGAGIKSSEWIAAAAERVMADLRPDLTLMYLPHLDYDLQRFGPDSAEAVTAAREVDRVVGRVADSALERGAAVVALSEYGITPARRPIDVNRHLRRAGLLNVYTQDGMEYLDPWSSAAFAVADHQVAHVYVRDHHLIPKIRDLIAELDGVDEVLDERGKRVARIDHHRSGELVAVAEPDAWFTYYYWLKDECAPDFARTVEIHRKPGFDPAELFLDPSDRWVKARAALALLRRRLGFRYLMDVVPLDPSWVRGTHGRLPDDPSDGPVLICSEAGLERDRVAATEVRELLLTLGGIPTPEAAVPGSPERG